MELITIDGASHADAPSRSEFHDAVVRFLRWSVKARKHTFDVGSKMQKIARAPIPLSRRVLRTIERLSMGGESEGERDSNGV